MCEDSHGDSSVYEALVRLSQPFKVYIPSIEGHGNFGSLQGDSAASMRYCVTGDSIVKTSIGTMPIKDVYDTYDKGMNQDEIILENGELQVKSLDGSYNDATRIFSCGKHDIIKITLANGVTLKGTPNHPILTLDEELNYRWVNLEDVNTNTEVLLDFTDEKTLYTVDEKYDLEEARFLGAMVSEGYLIKSSTYGIGVSNKDLEMIDVVRDYIQNNKEQFMYSINHATVTDPKLYKLLQECIRLDLYKHISSNNTNMGYFSRVLKGGITDSELIEYMSGFENTTELYTTLCDAIQKYTSSRVINPRYLMNREVFTYEISSDLAYDMMINDYNFGAYSHNRKIPDKVFRATDDYKREFLRYLFEGDGCIVASQKNGEFNAGVIQYSTNSEDLKNGLSIMLASLGIEFGIYIDSRNEIPCYSIRISELNNIVNFKNAVGFVSSRKIEKLDNVINSYSIDAMLRPNNSNLYKSKNIENKTKYKHETKSYSNVLFMKYGINMIHNNRKLYNFLHEFYGRYRVCKINKIEHLEEKENVYTFRVDSDCHSYISNSIISHNTESKMGPYTQDMYFGDRMDGIEWRNNYDDSIKEPVYLPCIFPMILVNGVTGMAVGMATNIPPHNILEVIDTYIAYIQKKLNNNNIRKYLPGPDTCTPAGIVDSGGIDRAYTTGKGSYSVAANFTIEETSYGRHNIIFTSVLPDKNTAGVVEKIANLVKAGKLDGISDIADESSMAGIRIVITTKKGIKPKELITTLFSMNICYDRYGMSILAINNGVPKIYGIMDLMKDFHIHNYNMHNRIFQTKIEKHKHRLKLLDGLNLVIKKYDEAIKIITSAKSKPEAMDKIKKKYKLDDDQAEYILSSKLYSFVSKGNAIADEINGINTDLKLLETNIKDIDSYLVSELKKLKVSFKSFKRRSPITILKK